VREQAHHQRALEAYYGLGPGRSLAEVAKRVEASEASLKLWSRTFGWAARVEERDAAVATTVEEKATRVEVDRRTRNRKILEAGIIRGARAIADGEVKPTLQAIEGLIRLDEQLASQAAGDDAARELRSKAPEELRALLCDRAPGGGRVGGAGSRPGGPRGGPEAPPIGIGPG